MQVSTSYSFWGEHDHFVDDKGRVLMPQDFREGLGEEFVATRGPDKTIYVFPVPVWNEIQERLSSLLLEEGAGFLQRMFGGRTIVRIDPQSRLAIPKHLREWAGIDRSAVLVGQGQKIEIWSKSAWDAYHTNFTSEQMYRSLKEAGLSRNGSQLAATQSQ